MSPAPAAVINERAAGLFCRSGDLRTAEHEFAAALKNEPRFYPAAPHRSATWSSRAKMPRQPCRSSIARARTARRRSVGPVRSGPGAAGARIVTAEALTAFESALAADPAQAEARPPCRRSADSAVLEQELAHAREAAPPAGSTRRRAASGTAIAGSAQQPVPVSRARRGRSRSRDSEEPALQHYRQAHRARSDRRAIARARRRDSRSPR